MDKLLMVYTPPEVTGADVKFFRRRLRLSVNAFAGMFGVSRQHVARLERLERPLTSTEVMSIDLQKPWRDGKTRRKPR